MARVHMATSRGVPPLSPFRCSPPALDDTRVSINGNETGQICESSDQPRFEVVPRPDIGEEFEECWSARPYSKPWFLRIT